MKISVMGVGRMGEPIAANLLDRGFQVDFFDPGREALELQRRGARRVASISELTGNSVSVSVLPDGPATLGALEMLADGVASGHMHIAMGTLGLEFARRCDEFARSRNMRYIDAPVSGSVSSAVSGELAVFIGCDTHDLAEADFVLSEVSSTRLRVGPAGAGSAVKLAVNSLIAIQNQGIGEALALATASGVEPSIAYEAFLGSVASSRYMRYKAEAFVNPEQSQVTAPVSIIKKDVSLALHLAQTVGAEMPLTQAAMDAITQFASLYGEELDMSRIGQRNNS